MKLDFSNSYHQSKRIVEGKNFFYRRVTSADWWNTPLVLREKKKSSSLTPSTLKLVVVFPGMKQLSKFFSLLHFPLSSTLLGPCSYFEEIYAAFDGNPGIYYTLCR